MTALARCRKCSALTLDTDEDVRAHRGWHSDFDTKFENTRKAATEARDALAALRRKVADYESALEKQPAIPEPEHIVVTDMPDDPDDLDDDEPTQASQYVNDLDRDDDLDRYNDEDDVDDPAPTQPTYPGSGLYTPGPTVA